MEKTTARISDECSPEVIALLKPERLRQIAGDFSLSPAMEDALLSALPDMLCDDTLRLLDALHRRMFVAREDLSEEIGSWPTPDQEEGRHLPAMFYAFLFMSGIPAIRRLHEERGIPEEITRETLRDLKPWLEDYRKHLGHYGLRQLPWLYNHYSCKLYQLGRLQYLFESFDHPYFGYRQKSAPHEMALMAAPDLVVRADGRTIADKSSSGYLTIREETGDAWKGNLVTPTGVIDPSLSCLRKDSWDLVLEPGDPALSVHITATGPLHPEDCYASHRQAQQFFADYYPEYRARCFMCFSWLLDPALSDYLPESSNIVQFQKTFMRFPVLDANDSQFRGLYPEAWDNPAQCQPTTSLQKALLTHLVSGKSWALYGGIVHPLHGGLAQQ